MEKERDSEDDYIFWISGNTPSSKNGRIWTGTYFIASKATQRWRKETKLEWRRQKHWFQYMISTLPRPLYIEFTFVRKSRHKFDYINICQAVQDEMKSNINQWIIEDDADEIKPYFGDYIYDKDRPGVIIRILKTKPNDI